VDKAKELLQYTTFNVSEVSQQVGFKSIFHFSKVFRQISGAIRASSSSSATSLNSRQGQGQKKGPGSLPGPYFLGLLL